MPYIVKPITTRVGDKFFTLGRADHVSGAEMVAEGGDGGWRLMGGGRWPREWD